MCLKNSWVANLRLNLCYQCNNYLILTNNFWANCEDMQSTLPAKNQMKQLHLDQSENINFSSYNHKIKSTLSLAKRNNHECREFSQDKTIYQLFCPQTMRLQTCFKNKTKNNFLDMWNLLSFLFHKVQKSSKNTDNDFAFCHLSELEDKFPTA